jgi:hypothetical protein
LAEDRDEAAEETQEGWEEAQQGELICPEDVRAKMQQHKEDWLKIRRLPEFLNKGCGKAA